MQANESFISNVLVKNLNKKRPKERPRQRWIHRMVNDTKYVDDRNGKKS